MSQSHNAFFDAIRKTLSGPREVMEWLLFSGSFFFLLVMVPVWTTPGDDLFFQLSITPPGVIVLMAVLALSNALIIMMQLHIRKTTSARRKLHAKATEGATALGILFGSLAATIACAACYSSLLALFGLGATTFVVEQRDWIAAFTLILTGIALYYSSKRINNNCEVCTVPRRKP